MYINPPHSTLESSDRFRDKTLLHFNVFTRTPTFPVCSLQQMFPKPQVEHPYLAKYFFFECTSNQFRGTFPPSHDYTTNLFLILPSTQLLFSKFKYYRFLAHFAL